MIEPKIDLTLSLLNRILFEILGDKETILLKDTRLNQLVVLLDPTEIHWHIEGNTIWPKKTWLLNEERRAIQKKEFAEYKLQLDARKELSDALINNIILVLKIDIDNAKLLASKLLNSPDPQKAGELFKIDLSKIPQLKTPHFILDGKSNYML